MVRGLILVVVLTGCADAGPMSPVEGIVTDVQVASLSEVKEFTLELDSGEVLTFIVQRGNPSVAATELREHLNFAIRLEVSFHADGDRLVADAIEHGSGPVAPASGLQPVPFANTVPG